MQQFFALVLFFLLFAATASGNNQQKVVLNKDSIVSDKAEHYMMQARKSRDSTELALRFADSAINTYEYIPGSEALKAEALLFKGEMFLGKGKMQLAIRMFNRALTHGKIAKDIVLQLLAHKKLGDIYLDLENYKMSIEHFEAVMAYKENLRDPALYASVNADLGLIYTNFKDYKVALQHLHRALAYYKGIGNRNKSSRLLKRIADIYMTQNDLTNALNYFNEALAAQEDFSPPEEVSATLRQIGQIYLRLDKNFSAVSSLSQSLNLVQNDTAELIQTHLMIGKAHFKNGSFGRAEINFHKSLKLALKVKDKDSEAESLKYLADIYENKGYEYMSIRYFKNYVALKDSLLDVENKQAIAAMKATFEANNKEKAIEILQQQKALLSSQAKVREQKIESNRKLVILLTALIVSSIMLIVLLVRRHNEKKGINRILQKHLVKVSEQNEEIKIQRDTIKKNNAKLEEAQNIIIKQNKKLRNTNDLLEQTVSNRTLELYKAYKKLSFHVNNTSLAVIELNRNLEVSRWSEQAEKIFGWKAGEVLGMPYDEVGFIREKDIDTFKGLVDKLVQGETTAVYSTGRNYNKYSDLLYLEWNISILHNDDGTVDSILAIANDVTSREKAFTDLRDSTNDLDNFIYKASHDLRGPLARIQGIVNLGLMESREPVSREYFKLLDYTSSDLDSILSRLLMIYDVNHRKTQIERVNVYQSIAQTLDKIIAGKKIKDYFYHIDIPRELLISTDPVFFQIIVENMFDNALYYKDTREEKPQITFSTKTSRNNRIVFYIADNGMGIPEEKSSQIFDMFFHGAAKSGGTGLGLYMAKKVVESMGGSITLIKSSKNTIFKIVLPGVKPFVEQPTPEEPVLEEKPLMAVSK